jgi:hypothetical protein
VPDHRLIPGTGDGRGQTAPEAARIVGEPDETLLERDFKRLLPDGWPRSRRPDRQQQIPETDGLYWR